MQQQDMRFMNIAMEEAREALREGEVPVGAVVVRGGEIIARAHNRSISAGDPSAHAEMLAIRKAAEHMGNYRLAGTTLYVTLEPCVMCAGALLHARVERLVFGASDPKGGAVVSLYTILSDKRLNHSVQVTGGVLGDACGEILSRFFRQKRLLSEVVPP
ncbi:MAG: tRNA adenosine(34) deaminase TadA [Deltaproteobacteria bacterium]|nr:tRNA adenosine(34) deaminase TadA [Deltaproteobacteria bacterium]